MNAEQIDDLMELLKALEEAQAEVARMEGCIIEYVASLLAQNSGVTKDNSEV